MEDALLCNCAERNGAYAILLFACDRTKKPEKVIEEEKDAAKGAISGEATSTLHKAKALTTTDQEESEARLKAEFEEFKAKKKAE